MKEQLNGTKNISNLVDSSHIVDRRKFIFDSASALAGLLMTSSFFNRIVRASSLEVKKGATLKEGLLELRQEVINNPNEVGINFRIKDGRGSWENQREGETDHLGQSMNEINFIRDSMKEGYTEVHCYHTHDLKTAQKDDLISDKNLEAARRGEQIPMPSIPPSVMDQKGMGDLGEALYLRVWFKNHIETKCMAVDANGVWSYIPDESHPFVEKYMKNFHLLIQTFLLLRRDPITKNLIDSLSQDKKQDLPSLISYLDDYFFTQLDSNMASIVGDVSKKWKELFVEFQKEREILYKTIGKFKKDSSHKDSPSIAKLVMAYKNLGFTVNFTNFKDLK